MAELVQGQSAPVGMKAEGFVDALHRVRQVRVRPLAGAREPEAGQGRARWGGGGRAWGREAARADASAGLGLFLGLLQPEEPRVEAPPRGPGPACRAALLGAAAGKGFARVAWPHRAPTPGLDLHGIQRGLLRFARGGAWGAHGEDPGVDRKRPSQAL